MKISYTVSRGSIVDEDGLVQVLEEGKLGKDKDKSGGIKINARRGFPNRTMLTSGRIETSHRGDLLLS